MVTPSFYDLEIIANLTSIFLWKERCFRSPTEMVFNLVWVMDSFETPKKATDTSSPKNFHMDHALYIISGEINYLLKSSTELMLETSVL